MGKTFLIISPLSFQVLLWLSCMTFGAWACSTGKHTTEQNAFRIVKATAQPWVGGELGSGSGEDYKLLLVVNQQKLTFDSLWTNKHRLPIAPKFQPGRYAQSPYNEGDTVMLQAKWTKGRKQGETSQQKDTRPFDGDGLLKYRSEGRVHYETIDSFQKLPKVHYPTQN